MDKNKEIVKELNDFLKGINMGYDTFKSYLEKLEDPDLKSEFEKIIAKFNVQKKVVVSNIEHLGGEPKDSLGVTGEIASMFEKLKEVFMDNDKEILQNAVKGMEMGIQGSEKVIGSLESIPADNTLITTLKDIVYDYKVMSRHLDNLLKLQ